MVAHPRTPVLQDPGADLNGAEWWKASLERKLGRWWGRIARNKQLIGDHNYNLTVIWQGMLV